MSLVLFHIAKLITAQSDSWVKSQKTKVFSSRKLVEDTQAFV